MFKIATALTHSFYAHHIPVAGGEAAFDLPLKHMQDRTLAALAPSSLEHLLKDLRAQIALSTDGERVMPYE